MRQRKVIGGIVRWVGEPYQRPTAEDSRVVYEGTWKYQIKRSKLSYYIMKMEHKDETMTAREFADEIGSHITSILQFTKRFGKIKGYDCVNNDVFPRRFNVKEMQRAIKDGVVK